MEAEQIFRTEMFERIRSLYPDLSQILVENSNFELFTIDDLPFGLFLLERDNGACVCVLIYDPDNNLRGVIINESTEALAWGEQTYQRYKRRAKPAEL